MSRQQTRQKERENLKAYQEIKNLSPLALELVKGMVTGIEKARLEKSAKLELMSVMHCMYSTALYADYGFSTTRINRTIEAVNKQFFGVMDNSIDPKTEIIDWCIAKKIDFTLEVGIDGEGEGIAV